MLNVSDLARRVAMERTVIEDYMRLPAPWCTRRRSARSSIS
jgi:hypothetical protein